MKVKLGKKSCILLALLPITILTGCGSSPVNLVKSSPVEILHSGTYTYDLLGSETNSLGGTGRTIIGENIVWTEQTQRVKAAVGVSFGFDYVIKNSPGGTIETIIVTTYPDVIRDKSGRRITKYDVHKSIFSVGDTRICGYTIENEQEIIPGTWTMSVILDDQIVAQRKFVLYQ